MKTAQLKNLILQFAVQGKLGYPVTIVFTIVAGKCYIASCTTGEKGPVK